MSLKQNNVTHFYRCNEILISVLCSSLAYGFSIQVRCILTSLKYDCNVYILFPKAEERRLPTYQKEMFTRSDVVEHQR
jgi:hypothetical protein